MKQITLIPRLILPCLIFLIVGCDKLNDSIKSENTRPMPTRPVTVVELNERDFMRERELTGAVSLYREEDIGFEIGGRVTLVLDEGLEVRGPTFNEKGALVRKGDPIAVMEGTRYGSQVGALRARLEAARRDLQVVMAKAKLSGQTLKRQKIILAKGAGSQQAVDNAQSAYDQSHANIAARKAAIQAVDQQLTRAVKDLGDAVLYAPFSGRITKVHVYEGAVVSAGTPIVTLTLMDPVQVQVEVSADTEREIQTGDRVIVYPKDPLQPGKRIAVNAIVYEKSAVADSQLRTFRLVLMLRNERYHVYDQYPELLGLPVVNEYLPAVREFKGEGGPLYVPINALLEDNGQMYVLRLPGVSFHDGAQRSAVGKHMPERVNVTLEDQYSTVVKWNFRSISEQTNLREDDFLILKPRAEFVSGVAIGRPRWLFRPRDLVAVRFNLTNTEPGFYVPNHAIVMRDGMPHVFRVNEGKAQATPVSLFDSVGENRRIEGVELSAGTRIVVEGVHYLNDGQPVTIAETIK